MTSRRPITSHELFERAFGRTAGASLISGNSVEVLIDARAHFDAWLDAIAAAHDYILLENYMIADDAIGRRFRDALTERANAGVRVFVIRDWLGCMSLWCGAFWQPLLEAGGQVRVYHPPQSMRPLTMFSRDHRKMLSVDGKIGFLSGVCISEKWLGDADRDVPPWRDTGISVCGPSVAELERAFADSWSHLGDMLPLDLLRDADDIPVCGEHALRVIATQPTTAGVYRMDQLVAAVARSSLWLTDAYFVGMSPYVQALSSAARDGVDVRLLVPGASDIPLVARMSRAGYRALLQAGVRVFEWNGSMLHAKTAVADARWARVGSSNLNLASWLGNREIDVAIEDRDIARQLADQFERDLENATEIVLAPRRLRRGTRVHSEEERPRRPKHSGGGSSRAAAGAMRLAHSVGAALTHRRVLRDTETTPMLSGALALLVIALVTFYWPAVLGWPLAFIALWLSTSLMGRWWRLRRHRRKQADAEQADTDDDAW